MIETVRPFLTPHPGLRYFPAMPPYYTKKVGTIARVLLVTAGLFILAGCGKESASYVEVQEIEKQPAAEEPLVHTPGDGHDHGAAEPAGPSLFTHAVPQGWIAKQPSRMVMMAFQVGAPPETMADVSVSAFPGEVGGQLANINRWRRQVGLGPLDPSVVQEFITELEVSGLPAWQVSFTGPAATSTIGEPVRMVVSAVFHDGQTWFFKLVGAESAVSAELENYQAFLDSVSF